MAFAKRLQQKLTARTHPMWREILAITIPAFIELVMSTLFGMVDMVMVGRLGPAAITAVGLTNQPFMLLLAVFAAVNIGTTTLVAWKIGAGEPEEARGVTRQTLVLALLMGTVMSGFGVLVAPLIVRFMGAGPDTFADAKVYFQIVAAGLVFQVINLGITAALRGAGETKIPMLYNVGSNLFNVFGNYVLIYGKLGFPKWGVAGAAVSTSFSRFLGCLAGLYVLYFSRRTLLRISLRGDYRLHRPTVARIFNIGIPAALEQFVVQGGLMLFAKTVSGLGTMNFAAHQIGLNISGLSFAPSQAFSVASTTLVGQSLGADKVDQAERNAHVVHKIALIVAFLNALLFIFFSHPLARLYTSDQTVATKAGTILKILALSLPGQSTQLSLAGALRGAGDTMYPLFASATGIWIFRVVVAYLFAHVLHWGLFGAWVAFVLDQYTRAAMVYFRFRSGKWKFVKARLG
ncbi:MAG: MATE family efflux transporter [Firmicutes bacterium]|nr:MATE family efflux transporter [Bacillota bacterium]